MHSLLLLLLLPPLRIPGSNTSIKYNKISTNIEELAMRRPAVVLERDVSSLQQHICC